MLQQCQKVLAKAPSTHDPKRTSRFSSHRHGFAPSNDLVGAATMASPEPSGEHEAAGVHRTSERSSAARQSVGQLPKVGGNHAENDIACLCGSVHGHHSDAGGRAIETGGRPEVLAVSRSGVWVADSDRETLYRISRETGHELGQPIKVNEDPAGVAVGKEAVWVTSAVTDRLLRVVPK